MKRILNISMIMAAGVAAIITSCTANGRLQQYVENNNIRLAGKELSPGFYCEGMTIDADTVIVTYSLPEVTPTQFDRDNWSLITEQHKKLFLEGLGNDKVQDPDGAKILTDADVYMKGVFKYKDAAVNVLVSPEELKAVLGE